MELSATMVVEIGKNWVEADADTAEAIDFMEYYAREGLRYSQETPLVKINGEDNHQVIYHLELVLLFHHEFPSCHNNRYDNSCTCYRQHSCFETSIRYTSHSI